MRFTFIFTLWTLLILVFSTQLANAQDLEASFLPGNKSEKSDSLFITDLSDHLNLYLYGIYKNYHVTFKHIDSKKELKLRPNASGRIGLGFNYKWMGLAVAFKPPGFSDDEKYGNTQRLDVQINVFARAFGLDLTSQYYKGYYVANPNDFMAWNKEQYPLLENLSTMSMELSGYYFNNHKKFSYRAAFVRNEIQKKSAGSLILGAYTRMDLTEAPEGIMPDDLPDEYEALFNIRRFNSVNLGLSVGYTYTYVFLDNFFVNLSAVPGIGAKKTTIEHDNINVRKHGVSFRWIGRMALGYEHEKFFMGITAIATSNTIPGKKLVVSSTNSKVRFFVGKRFNTNKRKELCK